MPRRRAPQRQPPPEFVKELAEALGRVVIASSNLEHMLNVLLGDLLKLDLLQFRAFLLPMSVSNKISLVRQLGRTYLPPPSRARLKNILAELQERSEVRNTFAHGFYGVKRGKFALLVFSGEARFSGEPHPWQPSEIEDVARKIETSTRLIGEIRGLFPNTRLKVPRSSRSGP